MNLAHLKRPSPVSVHFLLPEEVGVDIDSFGLALMKGSVEAVKTEKDLFSVVSDAMRFPDYFGNNWDALDECLRDMNSWLPANGYLLLLQEAARGWSQNPYVLGRFLNCWLSASALWLEDQVPFHLVFVM